MRSFDLYSTTERLHQIIRWFVALMEPLGDSCGIASTSLGFVELELSHVSIECCFADLELYRKYVTPTGSPPVTAKLVQTDSVALTTSR